MNNGITDISDNEFDAAIESMASTVEAKAEELAADVKRSALEAEIRRLAQLDPVDYERERGPVADRLGIRRSVLDQLISKVQEASNESTEGKGAALDLRPPIPWHQTVNGDALLSTIVGLIKSHVVLSDAAAVAVALWIVFSYVLDCFSHSPRLALTSPTPAVRQDHAARCNLAHHK